MTVESRSTLVSVPFVVSGRVAEGVSQTPYGTAASGGSARQITARPDGNCHSLPIIRRGVRLLTATGDQRSAFQAGHKEDNESGFTSQRDADARY